MYMNVYSLYKVIIYFANFLFRPDAGWNVKETCIFYSPLTDRQTDRQTDNDVTGGSRLDLTVKQKVSRYSRPVGCMKSR
jgi:hypothetical protein